MVLWFMNGKLTAPDETQAQNQAWWSELWNGDGPIVFLRYGPDMVQYQIRLWVFSKNSNSKVP